MFREKLMKSEYSTKFGSPYPMGLSMRDGAINIVIEFPHSPKKVCGIILYTKNQANYANNYTLFI